MHDTYDQRAVGSTVCSWTAAQVCCESRSAGGRAGKGGGGASKRVARAQECASLDLSLIALAHSGPRLV